MLPSSTLKSIWRGSRPAYVPAIKSGVRIADVDEGSCPADREDFLGGIVRCIGRDLEEVAGREPDTAVDFVVERARGGAGPLEGERAVVEAGLVEPPELPTAPRPCAPPRAAAGGANADAGVAGEEPNAPAAVAAVRPTAMPIPMPTTTTRSLISHPLRCMSPSARCDDVPHPLYSTGGISNFCRQQKRSSGSPTGPRPRPRRPSTPSAGRWSVLQFGGGDGGCSYCNRACHVRCDPLGDGVLRPGRREARHPALAVRASTSVDERRAPMPCCRFPPLEVAIPPSPGSHRRQARRRHARDICRLAALFDRSRERVLEEPGQPIFPDVAGTLGAVPGPSRHRARAPVDSAPRRALYPGGLHTRRPGCRAPAGTAPVACAHKGEPRR